MSEFVEQSLENFRSCFSRKAAFRWFVLIIIAFILRDDHLGVTSTIRTLALDPACYEAMLHFFRSSAFTTQGIREKWYQLVLEKAPIYKVDGRNVLVGDGVKQSKEGRYMPGVKKLHQESEDSSKGEFIFGHLMGGVGVVIGDTFHKVCLPLRLSIQDGVKAASGWKGSTVNGSTHVIQMIENGFEAAGILGKSVFLLDRYFLSVPALKRLAQLNSSAGEAILSVVTKAKSSCAAYEKPEPREPGKRGRPPKKGRKVLLNRMFDDEAERKRLEKEFTKAEAWLYGKHQDVEYLSLDLLWGQGLYQELRFVLVTMVKTGQRSILVSTDLSLEPVQIIELYGRRFSIESCFRGLKQQFGGFCYHFWTRSMPKLNHFKKKDDPDPLETIQDENCRRNILRTIDATERYVALICIAMGLVQMMMFRTNNTKEVQSMRYTRSKTEGVISEATMIHYLQRKLLVGFIARPGSYVNEYIQHLQARDSGFQKAA